MSFCRGSGVRIGLDKDIGPMSEESREVRGRIPKDLKINFEIACARLELTQAAGMEEAIRDWLKKQEPLTKKKR